MKLLLLDDDIEFISKFIPLSNEINPDFEITAFSDSEKFVEYIYNHAEVEGVIIDIELGDISGIDIACTINELDPSMPIIFLTGYPEKYCQAIFLSDYELKPFAFISKPLDEKIIASVYTKLLDYYMKKNQPILFKFGSENSFVEPDDILYLESDKWQTRIYMKDKQIAVNEKLKTISKKMPEYFLFSHNSFLINCKYVSRFNSTDVILKNGKNIPLSRSKKQEFTEKLIYLKGFLKC